MSLTLMLSIAALVGAIVLARFRPVVLPVLAILAATLEVAVAFGVISVRVAHVPLPLVFGGVLAVTGIIMLIRSSKKWFVASATLVAMVGVIQTLQALRFLR